MISPAAMASATACSIAAPAAMKRSPPRLRPCQPQQQRRREHERERVGDVLAGDVRRRAVRRLRHRVPSPGIERAAEAEAAGQFGRQVGQDVAEHVGRDHDVEAPRRAHHMRHHRIDDELVERDPRGSPAPTSRQHSRNMPSPSLSTLALCTARHPPPAPPRELEGRARDPLAARRA